MMTSILKRWRYADYLLLLTLLALLAYGLLLVYSSTFPSTDTTEIALSSFVIRQGMFVAFGLLCMVIIASIDYRILHATAYLIYGVTILLLLVVLFGGHSQTEYGSQRWIDLKIFPLQPSELAKPALVMALARVLFGPRDGCNRLPPFPVFHCDHSASPCPGIFSTGPWHTLPPSL